MKSSIISLGLSSLCLIFSLNAFGFRSGSKCKKSEIEQQNCAIKKFDYKIHFLKNKVTIDNGVWKEVSDMPMADKNVEWHSLRMRKYEENLYIEMEIWNEPHGEAHVQGLNWIIWKINGVKPKPLIDKIVQRRSAKFKAPEDPRSSKMIVEGYSYDKKMKHGIRRTGNKVFWYLEDEQGSL